MDSALIAAEAVSKSYAGVQALQRVSFDVRAHEVHALVGENGAGKSTLIRILTGQETPDSGRVMAGGEVASELDPARALAMGIAVVHQQPSLFPDLSVAENLSLGRESTRPWHRVDWHHRRERARELLARVGAAIDPDRLVETLTMPEQQLVEIARALGSKVRVLVLDEPTASLPAKEVEALLGLVRRLREQDVGIVYISHKLDEVLAVADRVTVLRDGRSVATTNARALTWPALVRLMVGDQLHDPPARAPRDGADVVLEVGHLTSRAAGVRDVSLQVRRGEILGLGGLVGSGRTQLAETIFGIFPADNGTVTIDGASVHVRSPAEAVGAGIAYVPEDRRRHGILLDLSVAANSTLASLAGVARRGIIDAKAEQRAGQSAISRFGIKATSPSVEAGTLSGGNQQKVALARWLATSPRVLILDEPTQGVDVAAKGEIHRLIQELADGGLAVLLISSDPEELVLLSDRVAVMRNGTIAGLLPREAASRQAVAQLALGGPVSPVEDHRVDA